VVQISAKAAKNDLMVKVRQVEKFFGEGHPVEVNMRLRGREKRNKDWAMEKLKEFLTLLPWSTKAQRSEVFGEWAIDSDSEEIGIANQINL